MSPILYTFGKLTIYSYGLLVGLGIVVGMWLAERKAIVKGLDAVLILDLLLLETFALLLGSRLWYVIQNWRDIAADPAEIFQLSRGGFVFYGGLMLAIPVGIWFVYRRQQPVLAVADLVAPYVALGHAFGRMGCFLEGCCYGSVCKYPWGVEFPKFYSATRGLVGSPAFLDHVEHGWVRESQTHSLSVHPVQLYAVGSLLLLFAVLSWLDRRKGYEGQVMLAYLGGYSTIRFLLEMFRVNKPVLLGLSAAQVTSVLILTFALASLLTRGSILRRLVPNVSLQEIPDSSCSNVHLPEETARELRSRAGERKHRRSTRKSR